MFERFWKKVEQVPPSPTPPKKRTGRVKPPRAINPTLKIEVTPEGEVFSSVDFPTIGVDKSNQDMAYRFATMLFLLNDGGLLPVLQKAVAGCSKDKQTEYASRMTLNFLNQHYRSQAQSAAIVAAQDDLCVHPIDALNPRRG